MYVFCQRSSINTLPLKSRDFCASLTQYTRPAIQASTHAVSTFQNYCSMLHGFRRCGEEKKHEFCGLTHKDGGMTQRLVCRDCFGRAERTLQSRTGEIIFFQQNIFFR